MATGELESAHLQNVADFTARGKYFYFDRLDLLKKWTSHSKLSPDSLPEPMSEGGKGQVYNFPKHPYNWGRGL